MPVNRFDNAVGQRYVSTYVPLPFQELAALGENVQKRTQTANSNMSELEKMISDVDVANEVLSEGSGDDRGLKYRTTGYVDYKNQLLNKAKTAHQDLVDKYNSGEIDLKELERQSRQFNNQFKEDFYKLKVAESNSKAIREMDKKVREHKQVGSNPFLLNSLGLEGKRLLDNPFNTEYKGSSIGDALDLEKTKNEYADKFKSQILSSGAGRTDQFGNVIYTDKSGVTRDRIVKSVESTFDQDPYLGSQTKEQTNRWLNDNGYDWNTKVKLNDGTEVNAGDYYYNNIKQSFIDGVVAKAEQSEMKKQIRKDIIGAEQRSQAREDKKIEDALVGSPIESKTFDLSYLSQDPKGQQLLKDGIIKNNNGIIQLDKNKLLEITNLYEKYNYDKGTASIKVGEKQSFDKIKELSNFVAEIGKKLGYDSKDIKYDNFEKIINEYNAGSMMRIADEQMPAPVRQVETSKLKNNWNNYDFFDTDNPNVPLEDKPILEKGDEVILNNFRNNIKNGKAEMYRDGYIKKSNGEIIPILTKPASIIDDRFHDRVAEINLNYTKADLNQVKVSGKAEDGSSIIQSNIPIGRKGVVHILRTKDESGKAINVIQYQPINSKGEFDGSPSNFYNQADFQQFMNKEYYKTRVGGSETYETAPKKETFDSFDNEEDN